MEFLNEIDCNICLIQESWLTPKNSDKLNLIEDYDYNIISTPRVSRKGGGLAIVYKNEMQIKLCKKTLKFPSYESAEYILKCQNSYIRFVNIYRPPYSKLHAFTVKDFLQDFENHLSQLQKYPNDVIIVGDINIHLEKDNSSSRAFASCLQDFSYDLITDNTGQQNFCCISTNICSYLIRGR